MGSFPVRTEGKKDYEIVVLFPKENCVECSYSFTMDESFLDTDRTKRLAAQGWDILKEFCFAKSWGITVVSSLQKCRTANRPIRILGARLTWSLAPSIV